MRPPELAGGFGLPGATPLAAYVEQSFARRLEQMPARAAYLDAVWAACGAMHLAGPSGQVDVFVAVREAPPAAGPPSPEDLMLDGMATRFVDGFSAGVPTLRRALREFRIAETEGLFDIAWVWLAV
jgi:hypothetical protein